MKIIIRILILAILGIIVLASPTQAQAAPNAIESDQFSCANVTEVPQSECEALVAIYNPEINRPFGWLETTTPCNWPRIICEGGHVTELNLSENQLRSLPEEISNLTNLSLLHLYKNQLSSLPAGIGNLTNLKGLSLWNNGLSSLPAEIGNLTNLKGLSIDSNQLSSLPTEIGNLINLTSLVLSSNQLSHLPEEIGNLTNLTELDLAYNRLVISDENTRSFVVAHDRDWASTQTIAPTDVEVTVLDSERIELTWTPIVFWRKGGYYEISLDGGELFTVTTASKSISSHVIDGLASGVTYDIRIRTYTLPHAGYHIDPVHSWDDQRNELRSDYSPAISATTPITNNTPTSLVEDGEPSESVLFLPVIYK